MKFIKTEFINLLLFTILCAGCSSSEIINSWKSKNIESKKYNKILIIAMMNQNERNYRESMENHLVEDFRVKNITAVSSFEEYGPKSFESMEEKAVLEKLDNTGIDGVLTIVLLDKSKEKYYVPGRVYYSPYNIYHRRFWGYYTTIYERIYEPGYYTENTSYFWESNFYDLKSKELIYSVQTKSFNPSDAESLGHEYGNLICNDMLKNEIIR